MNRGGWRDTVHRIPKSRTQLKQLNTHPWRRTRGSLSSPSYAWKIPWTEEPGRLQSMGSLRVRHD